MLNGAKVANAWQPMSPEMWVGPSSRCISLMRGEHRPLRAAGAEGRRPRRQVAERAPRPAPCGRASAARARRSASASMPAGRASREERGKPVEHDVGGVVAGLRQRALAEHAGLDVGAAQLDVDLLLDVVGRAFLDHQHRALAGAEVAHLLRHQRIDAVEHVDRHARGAVDDRRGRAARARAARRWSGRRTTTMPMSARSPGMNSLSLCSRMKALRRRQALLDLQPLVHEQ